MIMSLCGLAAARTTWARAGRGQPAARWSQAAPVDDLAVPSALTALPEVAARRAGTSGGGPRPSLIEATISSFARPAECRDAPQGRPRLQGFAAAGPSAPGGGRRGSFDGPGVGPGSTRVSSAARGGGGPCRRTSLRLRPRRAPAAAGGAGGRRRARLRRVQAPRLARRPRPVPGPSAPRPAARNG